VVRALATGADNPRPRQLVQLFQKLSHQEENRYLVPGEGEGSEEDGCAPPQHLSYILLHL